MSMQQQHQNALQRFWSWLIGVAVAVLRSLGFKVSWGQPKADDEVGSAVSAYEAKEAELKAFLDAMAKKSSARLKSTARNTY